MEESGSGLLKLLFLVGVIAGDCHSDVQQVQSIPRSSALPAGCTIAGALAACLWQQRGSYCLLLSTGQTDPSDQALAYLEVQTLAGSGCVYHGSSSGGVSRAAFDPLECKKEISQSFLQRLP